MALEIEENDHIQQYIVSLETNCYHSCLTEQALTICLAGSRCQQTSKYRIIIVIGNQCQILTNKSLGFVNFIEFSRIPVISMDYSCKNEIGFILVKCMIPIFGRGY